MKSKLAKTSFKSYKIERVVTISKDISLLRQYWDLGHMFLVWQQILDSWQMGQHELGMQQQPSILKPRLEGYQIILVWRYFTLAQVFSWSPLPAREASSSPRRWESRSPSTPRQWGWRRWADRSRDAQRCPRTWVSIDQHGASKRAVIGPDQKKKGAQPPLKNGFIFHSLGEPLVGEEHRQTVPNVLLAAVFPSLPSHQRDHADRLWDLLPASYHGVTQGVDGRAKPVAVGGNL